MRKVLLSLCIVTQCMIFLQAINLYILYTSLDQYSLDIQAFKDDLHVRNVYLFTQKADSEEEELIVNNEEHKIQIARVAKPMLLKSHLMDSKHSAHNRAPTEFPIPKPQQAQHSIKRSPSSPFLPVTSVSDCDAFHSLEFNRSYNPEHFGGIKEKYKVAICTKVKDEAKYIEEWLLYYWLILRVSLVAIELI